MRPFPKVLSRVTEITMSLAYLTYWGAVDVAAPPVMYKTVHLLKMHTDLRPIWKYIIGNLPIIWYTRIYEIFNLNISYSVPDVSVPVESMLSTMKNLRLRVHFCESVPKTHTSIQYLVAIHKLYKKKFSRSYFKIWSICCIHLDKNNAGVLSSLSIQNTLFPMGILIKSLPYFSWVSCNFVYCLY